MADMKLVLGKLYQETKGAVKLSKAKGCAECGQTGYLGRIGIFEVLPVTEKIARLVLERSSADQIKNEAISESMITMMQDGYLKVIEGMTTLEEIKRVALD